MGENRLRTLLPELTLFPARAKKAAERLLVSDWVYRHVVRPSIRDGMIKTPYGFLCVGEQARYVHSMIYWRQYERREIRLIQRHLRRDLPVIDLGASLGVTTTAICATVGKGATVVSVEANPNLMPCLARTKEQNAFDNLELISAAVDYSGAPDVPFIVYGANLGSHKGYSDDAESVPTVRLSDIVSRYGFGQYSLVCDIEGAEVEMACRETDAATLNGCAQMIIELHHTSYEGRAFTPSDAADLIADKFRMRLMKRVGNVYLFEKVRS